jgi:hypothetical protein
MTARTLDENALMTVGRWFGPAVLDRHGRTPVVRAWPCSASLARCCSCSHHSPGWRPSVLWGLGASLGFPVGMSAGADEPAHAAGRVA